MSARLRGLGAGKHGTTFGGGPLVCRVGLEFFDVLDGLLPHISDIGSYFRMRLTELAGRFIRLLKKFVAWG